MEDFKNNANENNVKLINKLAARFHNSQIWKKLASLAIAGAITISLSACDYDLTVKPDNGDSDIHIEGTIPNPNNNQNNTENNNQSNNQTNSNLNEYSDLLKSVLTNDYYNSILDQAIKDTNLDSSAYLDPHPYAFLEDEGYDVEEIKKGNLSCSTRAFTKTSEPNNLYIATYVENKHIKPYYTEYLIKYSLTEQEMSDYDMMHKNAYIQSVFMNDAISEIKAPTIIHKTKCTVKAHNEILDDLRDQPHVKKLLNNNQIYDFVMTDFNTTDNTFDLLIISGKDNRMKTETYISYLPLLTADITLYDNSIYATPYNWGNYTFHESASQVNGEKATVYATQNHALNNASKFLLE